MKRILFTFLTLSLLLSGCSSTSYQTAAEALTAQAVLDAYEQALYQLPQRQQEYQAESTQNSESM